MNNADKKISAGLIIIILTSIWWMGFGIAEFVMNTKGFAGLFEGALVGGVLLLTGFAAYRWRRIGGWALVFEGMIPIYIAVSTGHLNPISLAVLSGPPIVGGLLFVLD
jgi:hypothetical protein